MIILGIEISSPDICAKTDFAWPTIKLICAHRIRMKMGFLVFVHLHRQGRWRVKTGFPLGHFGVGQWVWWDFSLKDKWVKCRSCIRLDY